MANNNSPRSIAESNFDAAFDAWPEIGRLSDSVNAYRENVGDSIQEEYGRGNVLALRDGLSAYDEMVEEKWDQLVHLSSISGVSVFMAFVDVEWERYLDTKHGWRFGNIEYDTDLDEIPVILDVQEHQRRERARRGQNPKKKRSRKNPKRVKGVRSLVSNALK